MSTTPISVLRNRVTAAALHIVAGDLEETERDAGDAKDAAEHMTAAARDLVAAVDALPARERPDGWNAPPPGADARERAARRRLLGPVTVQWSRSAVVGASLAMLLAEYRDGDPVEAEDTLAYACRTLVNAADQEARAEQPPEPGRAVELAARPGPDGLLLVEHGLGTPDVRVVCKTPSGASVGHLAAVVLDDNRVEIAPVPGIEVASVRVELLEN
ncbi:hypothetical protein [Actinomadura violacea]|uniref:Uncharacterized protein n=1 Tax=Actinomadura violacea TaxID=2819934 RepID=A0ABS3S0B7_9ACTN|nr:hypothetical protein [Actinomadura violacea]MBO2461710.1 hypothetical protein [Actinomadura violacea]